jgi:uncharacterized protein (DUF2461 family)
MLQKTTLDFLNDLKKNNKKDWFEKNKPNFEKAKLDFEVFISELFFQLAKTNKNLIGVDPRNVFLEFTETRDFLKIKSLTKQTLEPLSARPANQWKPLYSIFILNREIILSLQAGGICQIPLLLENSGRRS